MQTKYTRYQENKDRTFQVFAIFSMAIAFFYTALRANLLSMTHDESVSYLYYALLPKSFLDIVTYRIPTTNNHLLNSLLMRITTHLWGNSEFVIRMPSLIGHLLFLTGIYKILIRFLRNWPLIIGIWFIIFQPFPLDYFTCARGYGLGLGFMAWGLHFFFKTWFESQYLQKTFWAFTSLFLLVLSTFSNLAFLNIFITVIFLMGISEAFKVFRPPGTFSKKVGDSISFLIFSVIPNAFILFLVYSGPIAKLREKQEFIHGGNAGLWKESIGSLISSFLYGKTYFPHIEHFVLALVILILTISAIVILQIIRTKQKMKALDHLFILIFSILLIIGLSIWAQHILLGLVFPYDRAVIYFLPIFLILLLLLKTKVSTEKNIYVKKTVSATLNVVLALSIFHSFNSLNLKYFLTNQPDVHTKDAVLTMAKLTEGKNIPQGSLHIGLHHWFTPTVNLYLVKYDFYQFSLTTRDGFDGLYDFYYVREEDKWVIAKFNLKVLKHYDIYPAYLAVPQDSPFADHASAT